LGAFPRTAITIDARVPVKARTVARHRSHENKGNGFAMIRKLKSGKYRLYSRKADPRTGKRRNLGTFDTRSGAEKHERAVQFFKHHG
jgi:hypothetical protein